MPPVEVRFEAFAGSNGERSYAALDAFNDYVQHWRRRTSHASLQSRHRQ